LFLKKDRVVSFILRKKQSLGCGGAEHQRQRKDFKMRKVIAGVLVVCILCTSAWADPKLYLKNGSIAEGGKVHISDEKVTLTKGFLFRSSEDFPKEEVLAVVDGTSVLFSQEGIGFMEVTEYPNLSLLPIGLACILYFYSEREKGKISKEEASLYFAIGGLGVFDALAPKKEMKPVVIPSVSEEELGKELLQDVRLSFPLKATIHRKDGTSFLCTIRGIEGGFVEYQKALFGTDKIALRDIDFIETYRSGVRLKPERIIEQLGGKLKSNE
jgi:hypothetical protein